VTADPLVRRALELLSRGHDLYGASHSSAGLPATPHQLRDHAERMVQLPEDHGARFALSRTVRMAEALRSSAAEDGELAAVLVDAHADHTRGRRAARAVLEDAHGDPMPAADTPLGRREALRRMAARLQMQRRHIHRSRHGALLLARRLRRLGYLSHSAVSRRASGAAAIPLGAVRYNRSFPAGHVRAHIVDALDHMGITDPAARRNWLRGYQTLIARESGGRPSAVASEPATAAGPPQSDGHGLGYARGITQTIPATFARYHQPGTSTNIYDPVANICASMNYVMHRYGVAANGENLVALVQQADARRPPRGY
jgi:SLT domain-containing protein